MLLDDVRHVFGSVQHETIQTVPEEAGIPSGVRRLIMNAAQKAKIFMGGEWGASLAMASLSAGIARGFPLSALVFCLTIHLCIVLVIQNPAPVHSDAGPLLGDLNYPP